jgi:hypothetical protein
MPAEDSDTTKVDIIGGGGDAGDALGRSKWVNETKYIFVTVSQSWFSQCIFQSTLH